MRQHKLSIQAFGGFLITFYPGEYRLKLSKITIYKPIQFKVKSALVHLIDRKDRHKALEACISAINNKVSGIKLLEG